MLRRPRLSRHSDLRELADEDLMARAARGDARAFEIIFDRHGPAAFSLSYRMCGRRGAAEDVVQEAFLSLWRAGARYDPVRGSVRTWMLATVRARSIDALRSGAVHQGRDAGDDESPPRVEAPGRAEFEVARHDEARRVRGALDELPTVQRHALELAYFGGFTHTQIADMLALPPAIVKGRIRLGLSNLQIAFAQPGDAVA